MGALRSDEMLHGGPLRAALNARDMAEARREAEVAPRAPDALRAPVGAAEGLDGDGLAPARGVCLGARLGAMLWCLIGAAWFAAVGR